MDSTLTKRLRAVIERLDMAADDASDGFSADALDHAGIAKRLLDGIVADGRLACEEPAAIEPRMGRAIAHEIPAA